MRAHEIKLRAPEFLGGGPDPIVIRRTDQRFLDGLFRDLRSEEGREVIGEQVLPRADEHDDPVLFLPVQRCFNVVLVEAYCDAPGKPRVDPESIEGAGVVLRRRRKNAKSKTYGGPERWVAEHGRARGWLEATSDELHEDPETKKRRLLSAGHQAIDRELSKRRELALRGRAGALDESSTDLFVAPPDICAALGTTLLYGLVDPADPVVAEPPRRRKGASKAPSPPSQTYSKSQVTALLAPWLRPRSSRPPVPSSLRGRKFRARNVAGTNQLELVVERETGSGWERFDVPTPWGAAPGGDQTDDIRFMRMLWQAQIELQAFSGKPAVAPLRQTLQGIEVALPDDRTSTLYQVLADASQVFVMLEEGATAVLPEEWPEISETLGGAIVDGAKGSLEGQLERFTRNEGRYANDHARYEVTAFARVRHEEGCPPALVWSEASTLFRIAKWYEGGPDDAVLPTIELPALDRGFFKKLKPNVTIKMPRSMFNFLQNNKPEDLLEGNAKNDTRGPPFQWICGFNISIIFIIAFMLLISFVLLLNIVFWWVAFFRICIPLPTSGGGEEAEA